MFENFKKKKVRSKMKKLCLIMMVSLMGSYVMATAVPLVNPGFESPDGPIHLYPDSGWEVLFGDVGRQWGGYAEGWSDYNPPWNAGTQQGRVITFWYDAGAGYSGWDVFFPGVDQTPYGDQIADVDICGHQQSLGVTLQANATYTIELDMGYGMDNVGGWFNIELAAGDDIVMFAGVDPLGGRLEGVQYGMQGMTQGQWTHQTLVLTTTGATAGLGEDLTLRFYGQGSIRGDNFAVDVIPEPATMILLGLGSLFACKKRRK